MSFTRAIAPLQPDAPKWQTAPTDVEEAIDRLLTDPNYLTWQVVRNNRAGVVERFRATTDEGMADYSVAQLYDILRSLDDEERANILDGVPYITGNDPVMDQAFKKMLAQATSGAGMNAAEREKVVPIMAIGAGLSALTGIIGSIGNGKRQREAERAAQQAEATARAQAEASNRKLKLTLTITGIVVGIALLVAGLVYAYRRA